ncbi:hypothetical protein [Altererythrobacter sp. BO-6]|nr:hypothetical protein [Altererythrobacter sp. BO-6]
MKSYGATPPLATSCSEFETPCTRLMVFGETLIVGVAMTPE